VLKHFESDVMELKSNPISDIELDAERQRLRQAERKAALVHIVLSLLMIGAVAVWLASKRGSFF
jgi:hypothetical protein